MLEIDLDNLRMKFLAENLGLHFNNVSFDVLNSKSLPYIVLKFE